MSRRKLQPKQVNLENINTVASVGEEEIVTDSDGLKNEELDDQVGGNMEI